MENENLSAGIRKSRPLDLDPSVYLRSDYLVLDFETTNIDHGSPVNRNNSIILACWLVGKEHPSYTDGRGVRSQFGTEFEQQRLLDDIERASFVVAFHAKFEAGWLRRCGVELRDLLIYDPMLGEYCLAGNTKPDGGFSLDATLKRYRIPGKMRYVSALIDSGVCPSRIPQMDLREYCGVDVKRTEDLFLQQQRRIIGLGLDKVLYGRCLATPMLADIEARGCHLDAPRVLTAHTNAIQEFQQCDRALQEFCGGVNWDSPKQVAGLLYDKLGFAELKDYRGKVVRTDSGNRSASNPTIEKLRGTTSDQRKFLKLWGTLAPLKKMVSNLETMKEICEKDNGHFFAQFNQAVTQNHRLSSTGGKWGLQLQNQSRSLKKLFCSGRKGCRIAEGDCPQLEFRTGVDLTGDPVGLADVLARADVHTLTSSVTGFTRQESKPHTFKPIYGGKSGPPRLVRYYEAFRARYSGLYNGQLRWVYSVLETGQLRIPSGLIFYWPDTRMLESGYITNTTKIFNYPISSFAGADIALLSLVLVWHGMRGWSGYICNTVHDSGIGDIPVEESCKFRELMVQSYTNDIYEVLAKLYDYDFSTPLGLGYKEGEHWGEGEEAKYEPEKRFKFTSDKPTAITLN